VILCSLAEISQYFGGMYFLHLQGESKSPASSKSALLTSLLTGLFNPANSGIMFLQNVGYLLLDYMELHPRRWY
jgi:hypothetical protein